MVFSPAGLSWQGPAATVTDPFSRQRGLYKIRNPQLSKEIFKEKEHLPRVPDGCLIPRRTGRLTVGRNITLSLTLGVKLPNAWDYSCATLFLGEINTATWPSRLVEPNKLKQ
jgi:hypothetical protein